MRLPGGSSAAQIEALDSALGSSLGRAWTSYAHGFADAWDVLRKHVLEHPYRPSAQASALMRQRATLHTVSARLPDPRLTTLARFHAVALGQDPRHLPAWWGVIDHLENNFGTWGAPTGLGPVLKVLEARLVTRKVTVVAGTEVLDVDVRSGPRRACTPRRGGIRAGAVVVAVDPRGLPTLAPYARRTHPAAAPRTTLLGLGPGAPRVDDETVLHGSPTLVVRPGGLAPDGHQAWSVSTLRRGRRSGRPARSARDRHPP